MMFFMIKSNLLNYRNNRYVNEKKTQLTPDVQNVIQLRDRYRYWYKQGLSNDVSSNNESYSSTMIDIDITTF